MGWHLQSNYHLQNILCQNSLARVKCWNRWYFKHIWVIICVCPNWIKFANNIKPLQWEKTANGAEETATEHVITYSCHQWNIHVSATGIKAIKRRILPFVFCTALSNSESLRGKLEPIPAFSRLDTGYMLDRPPVRHSQGQHSQTKKHSCPHTHSLGEYRDQLTQHADFHGILTCKVLLFDRLAVYCINMIGLGKMVPLRKNTHHKEATWYLWAEKHPQRANVAQRGTRRWVCWTRSQQAQRVARRSTSEFFL